MNSRTDADRRSFTWRTVFYGFLRSRRRETRRTSEGEAIFTDYHHPWLFFLAIGTMLLSAADAFLTLQLIDLGMMEVNSFMNVAMGQSVLLFTVTKLGFTAFGILFLFFLAKSRFLTRFLTVAFLAVCFSVYCSPRMY